MREWVAARARLHPGGPAAHGREAARDRRHGAAGVPASWRASGQIEISTTPYYHPILPLLCDSIIAAVSHPGVPLPPRFRYPQDARRQLVLARDYIEREFGVAPVGLWPSEGSVSDEAFDDRGGRWVSSGRPPTAACWTAPWRGDRRWRDSTGRIAGGSDGRELGMIFRDHFLSDLIGFVYSQMDAARGGGRFPAAHPRELRAASWPPAATRWCPIILDGENAWEYYDRNGRPFLRELYRRI